MNAPKADPLAWPARKLAALIVIAVLVQLALITWLSAKGTLRPRSKLPGPSLQLVTGANEEWLRLTDPTLFSRANPEGFSGEAWLGIPAQTYLPTDKGDMPLWLGLAPESLGSAFQTFVKAYSAESRAPRSWRPPAVTVPTFGMNAGSRAASASIVVSGRTHWSPVAKNRFPSSSRL